VLTDTRRPLRARFPSASHRLGLERNVPVIVDGDVSSPVSPVQGEAAPESERLSTRAFRFSRALIVGGCATAGDFTVLTTLVRLAGVDPAWARAPALLTGACIQFLGNRTFTFRAQAGRMSRQAKLFVAFESVTLLMNWGIFQGLLKLLPQLPPELLSFMGTFLVFICFNYPMRKNVIFRLPR
jgi:putative flippase GtrA